MKESAESHDTIMTAGTIPSAFPKADKAPVNQQGEIHVLRTLEQIQAIRPIWEALQAESGRRMNIEADFDRYISHIESDRTCEPYVLLLSKNDVPHAMLIGTRGPVKINCKLGYLMILKPMLRGLTITYGGYLGNFSEETCGQLLSQLYAAIRDNLADVVIFRQLSLNNRLYLRAREYPFFCLNHFPKINPHWQMSIPEQMDSFYNQHSSKSRQKQKLKRLIRSLEKNHQVRLVESTDFMSLNRILSDAADISSRTYQHALGWGLMDDVTTRRQLQVAANSRSLHLHVLYLDDKPCAFQLGFQYGRTYFLQKMGFDRDFKKRCVGTVLFLKITDQLCKDPNVDCLDFGFGDADYKRRFGTKHWDESTVYMFAPRAYPVLVNLIYTIVNGLSIGMRWVVHKAGVEGKIKQKWRRLLQKSRNSDSK